MNLHFHRIENPREHNLQRAYGRLDHIEQTEDPQTILLAFDLVDAKWLDEQGKQNPLFNPERPYERALAWQKRAEHEGSRLTSPFESMPLYRLEIEVQRGQSGLGLTRLLGQRRVSAFLAGLAELEKSWLEFKVFPSEKKASTAANLYAGIFADPVPVYVSGKMPSAKKLKGLSSIFSLAHLPQMSTIDLEKLLSSARADYLAIYDVGQGNANALMAESGRGVYPTLYYDLGAGVYRNKHTTPPQLMFCFTKEPPIVLSHWDADHWAGAYVTQINNRYPALARTWIAPFQAVGPTHLAFAHDVISKGGKFYTYCVPTGTVGSAPLADDKLLRFTLGNGRDRNSTGIVLSVEAVKHPSPRSWLLTGDCDYAYFMGSLNPLPPVGMVAPHHGAGLSPSTPVPLPTADGAYRRLVYSFGKDNKHGSRGTSHPTAHGIALHNSADWDHNAWNLMKPGYTVAGGDVLATCEHSPGNMRGGILIGWDTEPYGMFAPCGGSNCTTKLTQL